MRNFHGLGRTAAAVSLVLTVAACGRPGGAAGAPEGESDFSCAALIYAANDLVTDGKVADPDGTIASKHFAAMTGYATEYAKANGLAGDEAFIKIKIEGNRLRGRTSFDAASKIPDDKIVERARKCLAPTP